MPRPRRPLPVFALLLGLLTGCATSSDKSAEDAYQAPPPGPAMASIVGTTISEGGLFGNEYRGFVFMVDLKNVRAAGDNTTVPLTLTPGPHNIGAEFRYSNFQAKAYLTLDARAGVTYQLMIKPGRDDAPEGHQFNDFWIVEQATGQVVTKTYRKDLSGGKKGTIFYNGK